MSVNILKVHTIGCFFHHHNSKNQLKLIFSGVAVADTFQPEVVNKPVPAEASGEQVDETVVEQGEHFLHLNKQIIVITNFLAIYDLFNFQRLVVI